MFEKSWGGRAQTFNLQSQNLTLYQLRYTPMFTHPYAGDA